MDNLSRFPLSWAIVLAVAIVSILAAGGCANLYSPSCAQFEESRKETDYTTQYRLLESAAKTSMPLYKPLAKKSRVAVRVYKMQLQTDAIKPCNHLILHKEISLQRAPNGELALEESREFYAADGALIA